MMRILRTTAAVALTSTIATLAACGGGGRQNTANGDVGTPASSASAPAAQPEHHSKLAGAAVGGVIGHELGGHAVAGAAVGALVQHHRNKKAR
jgi:hypothetical protein